MLRSNQYNYENIKQRTIISTIYITVSNCSERITIYSMKHRILRIVYNGSQTANRERSNVGVLYYH